MHQFASDNQPQGEAVDKVKVIPIQEEVTEEIEVITPAQALKVAKIDCKQDVASAAREQDVASAAREQDAASAAREQDVTSAVHEQGAVSAVHEQGVASAYANLYPGYQLVINLVPYDGVAEQVEQRVHA